MIAPPPETILRSSIGGGATVVVTVACKGELKAIQLMNLIQQLSLMEMWLREDEALANACRHPRTPVGMCVSCGDYDDTAEFLAS